MGLLLPEVVNLIQLHLTLDDEHINDPRIGHLQSHGRVSASG
jgi:hypothetical protein